MFSETHAFSRSPCLNVQAVAHKQGQMPEKLKKVSFPQNEIYHTTLLSEVATFKFLSVLPVAFFNRSLCCRVQAVAQKQQQMLTKLKNGEEQHFSQNQIYHATEFSELVIFKCSSVLPNAWF